MREKLLQELRDKNKEFDELPGTIDNIIKMTSWVLEWTKRFEPYRFEEKEAVKQLEIIF